MGAHCPGWSQLLSTFKQLELRECAMMSVLKPFLLLRCFHPETRRQRINLESGPLLSHRNKEKKERVRERERNRQGKKPFLNLEAPLREGLSHSGFGDCYGCHQFKLHHQGQTPWITVPQRTSSQNHSSIAWTVARPGVVFLFHH